MKINKIFILFLLTFEFFFIDDIFSQEGGNIQVFRYKWLMGPRMIPWDSIPSNAYYNMMQQKMSVRTAGFYTENDVWTSLGPQPIYAWTTSAGRVSTVAYDPRYTDGSVIFLGSCGGGVWKSTDGGETWVPKTDNKEALACGFITIDPNLSGPHSIIYCGTGEGVWFGGAPYSGCGILKSTDGGDTWDLKRGGELPYRTTCYKIAICPKPGYQNLLFAALQTGLYKSTDAGESWYRVTQISNVDRQCTDVTFSPDGNKVYVIGPPINYFYPGIGGYYISEDMGNTFSNIQFTNRVNRRSKVIVCKNEPNYVFIYFGNDNPDNQMILYKSTDGGYNFDAGTALSLGTNGGWASSYTVMFNVQPNNHNVLYYGAMCLHKSTDWGNTFCDIGTYNYGFCDSYYGNCNGANSGGAHPDIHCMDFSPGNPNNIIIGCDGGVYTSSDAGLSWNLNTNSSLTLTQFYRFTSFPFNESQVTGGAQDMGMMFKSWYLSWYICNGGDGQSAFSSLTRPNNAVGSMCGSSTQALYSTNGGVNFLGATLPGETDAAVQYQPFVSHPFEPGVFFALRNAYSNGPIQIYKSIDDGVTYQLFSQGPTNSWGQKLAISKTNTNIMYITAGHSMAEFHEPNRIYRFDNSLPPEQKWSDLFDFHSGIIPDRYFSALEIDPLDEDIVYVGLSGFECDHLWRTTDGGHNWASVSGTITGSKLPDGPVNDILIYYSDANTKNILVATDAGVFISSNAGYTWMEFGDLLPNALETNLFYNRLQCKLRVSTLGRGVWEIPVRGQIFVNDNLVISSDNDGTKIEEDIVVGAGGKLTWIQDPRYQNPKLKFATGKKIIVQDGGQIDFSNANNLEIASQSGIWGGIEFQDGAYGILNNVTFNYTNTPITINGNGSIAPNEILIDNCNFNEGQVLIDSRNNVRIVYSDFTFTNFGAYNSAIYVNGSNNVDIQNNTITFINNFTRATGISANYSNVFIEYNTINKSYTGISASNCNAGIGNNTIVNTYGDPSYAVTGIELVNCYSSGLKENTVTGYQKGIYLFYSSPEMIDNNFTNSNTAGSEIDALDAQYYSSPRLVPSYEGDEVIWDGGMNTLLNMLDGNGIRMDDGSGPLIDYGYNMINGQDNYITGERAPIVPEYNARCNNWTEEPNPNKFTLEGIEVIYDPYVPNCPEPGGGGQAEGAKKDFFTEEPIVEPAVAVLIPPTYMIVDRGYGHFDTLQVRSSSTQLPADRMLFMQANKQELLGNFSNAINIYKQVIQNYKDSVSALNSLKRIITCYNRMNADTNQYSLLREYYLNLAQLNHTDTTFYNLANELAVKTLVRKTEYPQAINEYEGIIESSTDSSQILCAKLNIIQTYMLISQQGDAPSFTGKLSHLKPNNIIDGYRKIQQLLHGKMKEIEHKIIPKEFSLAQNYPNPFNPITTIGYSLPQNTKVVIKVYDILGKLVKELVNEFRDAGNYQVKFDGSNFASGVYFYKIEAGTFVDTKKMVLVK